MLSIVKGVSRNRNISELGIKYKVSAYVNRDSELYCSCPLVGCNLWLLGTCINTVRFMLLHCTFVLRVVSSSVKLSNKIRYLLHHFLLCHSLKPSTRVFMCIVCVACLHAVAK